MITNYQHHQNLRPACPYTQIPDTLECLTVRIPSYASDNINDHQPDRPGKRNTSRAVFTSHERALAKSAWSSSTARLSRESFLPFASCWLCLEPAIDPVACSHGDIFCRECALSNILAQKKEIKRNERARELEAQQELEDQARQDLEAQERAIKEFELTQAGLSIKRAPSANNKPENGKADLATSPGNDKQEDKNGDAKPNQKRKFSLDADEIARIAAEERAKLRKTIEEEKARGTRKHSLPYSRLITSLLTGVKTGPTILLVALRHALV